MTAQCKDDNRLLLKDGERDSYQPEEGDFTEDVHLSLIRKNTIKP